MKISTREIGEKPVCRKQNRVKKCVHIKFKRKEELEKLEKTASQTLRVKNYCRIAIKRN